MFTGLFANKNSKRILASIHLNHPLMNPQRSKYTEIESERERLTDRETDRQVDRETGRQADR